MSGAVLSMVVTIHIRDVVTNKAYKVDNLPPGLVTPAAFISGFGFTITKAFETVFSEVDSNYLPYHKYGTMFGAQVMSEFRNFTIQDPVFAENMESYISNCVAYGVMIGRKYDISELERTNNVWELMSHNASSLRMFNYRNGNKGGNL
ncbi:MAG: conjugal transfer protein TraG N-terminal domain-containing protein [Candidatus Midichloria sp.]|nr:conjugal transfer protein TraG N-terminal domain-containing protein [Candidatus Midichloria sp.]